MVGGSGIVMVVFMLFWFRLVNRVDILIGVVLGFFQVKVTPEGIPTSVDYHRILKQSCKSGEMRILVAN